jgi:hypothetical protein
MAEEKASVLVVANRTAESDELLEALRKRGQESPEHDLEGALERLRGAGLEIDGEIGDPDPVAAVQDAVNARKYDEVIVSTLHKTVSKWLKLDLPSKAAHATGLPVTHVEAQAKAHA